MLFSVGVTGHWSDGSLVHKVTGPNPNPNPNPNPKPNPNPNPKPDPNSNPSPNIPLILKWWLTLGIRKH